MQRTGVGAGVWAVAILVAAGLSLTAGCASQKKANPQKACSQVPPGCTKPIVTFAPALTPAMEATPSSDFVDAAGVQPSIRQRGWAPMASYYTVPVVAHGPLYFEDEMENVGAINSNCPSGWTWVDFASIPYSDARWMLNTIALPVSMIANPPWQKMVSDGEPGKRPPLGLTFDAAPCTRPVPTPFDLECPQRQAADLAQLTGGPLVATPPPASAATSVPASQPAE